MPVMSSSFARVLVLVLALTGAPIASAQDEAPEMRPDEPPATAPDSEPVEEPVTDDPAATVTEETPPEPQAPVLREGSRVVAVEGRVERDPATGVWRFAVPAPRGQGPDQILVLLPCRYLEELESTLAAANDREPVIEISGFVFLYREQNYLLLTHPARLVGAVRVKTPTGLRPAEAEGEGDGSAGERAADIIRDLERSVGPVVPRPVALPESEALPRREGSTLVNRRGQIRRTRTGAYVFVFDADSAGLDDPPLVVMPCRLLERFEPSDHDDPARNAVLLTGEIFVYRGTRYVMPRTIIGARSQTPMSASHSAP
jgi:hypothetical protein